jgi:ribosomal protein S18 acetylase RimI-like enzyme
LSSCYSKKAIDFLLERNNRKNLLRKSKDRVFHIAQEKKSKRIIGAIAVRGLEITFFGVDPIFQRQGIGKKLFSLVKRDKLFVYASAVAIPAYERMGFRIKKRVMHTIPGAKLAATFMVYHAV